MNTKYLQDPQRALHPEFTPLRNESLVLNKFKSSLPEYKTFLIETRNSVSLDQSSNLLREIQENPDISESNHNYNSRHNYTINYNKNQKTPPKPVLSVSGGR